MSIVYPIERVNYYYPLLYIVALFKHYLHTWLIYQEFFLGGERDRGWERTENPHEGSRDKKSRVFFKKGNVRAQWDTWWGICAMRFLSLSCPPAACSPAWIRSYSGFYSGLCMDEVAYTKVDRGRGGKQARGARATLCVISSPDKADSRSPIIKPSRTSWFLKIF